jgi:hypothetical protein
VPALGRQGGGPWIRRHIEIAWQSGPSWIRECRELIRSFHKDAHGAASLHGPDVLQAAREAGLRYACSPLFNSGQAWPTSEEGGNEPKKNSAAGGVWKVDGVNDRLPNSAELRR